MQGKVCRRVHAALPNSAVRRMGRHDYDVGGGWGLRVGGMTTDGHGKFKHTEKELKHSRKEEKMDTSTYTRVLSTVVYCKYVHNLKYEGDASKAWDERSIANDAASWPFFFSTYVHKQYTHSLRFYP